MPLPRIRTSPFWHVPFLDVRCFISICPIPILFRIDLYWFVVAYCHWHGHCSNSTLYFVLKWKINLTNYRCEVDLGISGFGLETKLALNLISDGYYLVSCQFSMNVTSETLVVFVLPCRGKHDSIYPYHVIALEIHAPLNNSVIIIFVLTPVWYTGFWRKMFSITFYLWINRCFGLLRITLVGILHHLDGVGQFLHGPILQIPSSGNVISSQP
jgi:hypothetical protein